ncbi:ABC transporter permease [Marinospirillum sp.]|uniref:ABC transporter permease n=1 Tax=Marinospirillum sp. TaxID=2183934 RepID=UPI00287026C6|nr:iron export ABC transporter permease subunit FetB [Marinospirillum sp.]MDR9469151.1 iron export ABC transporter permease subunit FetB [Marinospirillum sp.]
MEVIELSWWQLSIAVALVLLLALVTHLSRLGLTRNLLTGMLRTIIQLALIGLVLEALFAVGSLLWVSLLAITMLLLAGREVMARQKRRLTGIWAYGIGTLSMFVSSFSVALLTLIIIIGPEPWYTPQYAIPLLGMLLGNTMTGVALSLDRLTEMAWQQRQAIENRLLLGQTWQNALGDVRREALRAGMIPSINAMAAAGIISLPGMMTGQILAGTAPALAVKYQILIMLIIVLGTGLGTLLAVLAGSRRLFDQRQRLRLDRMKKVG